MTRYGFELSEKMGTPVMMRITTRLAHSRAGVETREAVKENDFHLPEDKRQFVLLPAIAKKRYKILLEKQTAFEEESDRSAFNRLHRQGPTNPSGMLLPAVSVPYLPDRSVKRKMPLSGS